MPKNDIGGFFVSLGLNIDRDSFETGNRLIDGVGNSFNKLIGSARNAAVVLAGTAIATGSVESAAYKMSEKLNISTESLDLWKASAKIAGVDANGLIGAMGRMANVIDHMKIDGTGLEEFTKQLGKLGIITDEVDIAKMLDMAPDELMTVIIQKAQEASAQAKRDIAEAKKALEVNPNNTQAQTKLANAEDAKHQAQTIVGDILGDEGKGLFIELERQGRSIDELKSLASKTIFTDRQTNEASQDFMEQVRITKTLSENITKLLGSDIGKALTPALTELNSWLTGHGDDIKNAMSSLAGAIEKIVGKTVDFLTDEDVQEKAKSAAKVVTDSIKDTATGTGKMVSGAKDLLTGNTEEGKEKLLEGAKQAASGVVAPIAPAVKTISDKYDSALKKDEMDEYGITDEQQYADLKNAQKIIHGHWKEYSGHKVPWITKDNQIDYNDLPAPLQALVDNNGGKANFSEIKDGIVRPDGTVTQVAPDDWVLAVRNLGDLSEAFAPVNYKLAGPEEKEPQLTADETVPQVAPDTLSSLTAAIGELAQAMVQPAAQTFNQSSGEYTINQTFNISGGNDMPQVLRQQAYRGTQEGLLEIMQQSSQRLQLMSGTR